PLHLRPQQEQPTRRRQDRGRHLRPARSGRRDGRMQEGRLWLISRARNQTNVSPGIAAQADIGLLLVSPESLDGAETRTILADENARLRGALLIRNRLQELSDPEPSCIPCSALRR